MQPPTTDQTKIWEAYTGSQETAKPVNESVMGRLFDVAYDAIETLAENQGKTLSEEDKEFCMLLFNEAFQMGVKHGMENAG